MQRNRKNGRIAVIGLDPGPGGTGRVMLNIIHGILELGLDVDLLVLTGNHPDLEAASDRIGLVFLGLENNSNAINIVRDYLERDNPIAVLCNKDSASEVVIRALFRSNHTPRVVIRIGTNVIEKLNRKNSISRIIHRRRLTELYKHADALIGNSEGVSAALRHLIRKPRPPIHTIYNPLDLGEIRRHAQESVDHPWLIEKKSPVIISVGRLSAAKDYTTLIKAFSLVRHRLKSKLIILGEGRQRAKLQTLANRLGLEQDLDLPGFKVNPFAFLARADVFVLSSLFEGAPNALMEALAVGTPTVATDCSSGPREILAGGRFGRLVPLKDPNSMAEAVLATLKDPPEKSILCEAVQRYGLKDIVKQYVNVLGDQKQE